MRKPFVTIESGRLRAYIVEKVLEPTLLNTNNRRWDKRATQKNAIALGQWLAKNGHTQWSGSSSLDESHIDWRSLINEGMKQE